MKTTTPRSLRSPRFLSRPAAAAVLALAAAAASLPALAMPGHHGGAMHPGHAMHRGEGGHGGHGGMPMGMMGHPGRIDRMLDGIEATPEQRSQVRQIAEAAQKDLQAQREAHRSLREQGRQIFTAPTVDARAAEAWRQQVQAQRDAASKRMMQAMLDVSRVLTPEQRARLAERMAARGDGRRPAMPHRHGGERPQS